MHSSFPAPRLLDGPTIIISYKSSQPAPALCSHVLRASCLGIFPTIQLSRCRYYLLAFQRSTLRWVRASRSIPEPSSPYHQAHCPCYTDRRHPLENRSGPGPPASLPKQVRMMEKVSTLKSHNRWLGPSRRAQGGMGVGGQGCHVAQVFYSRRAPLNEMCIFDFTVGCHCQTISPVGRSEFCFNESCKDLVSISRCGILLSLLRAQPVTPFWPSFILSILGGSQMRSGLASLSLCGACRALAV